MTEEELNRFYEPFLNPKEIPFEHFQCAVSVGAIFGLTER